MRFTTKAAATAALTASAAIAQTSTTCNPTEKSCPADTGLNSETFFTNFLDGESAEASWSRADYTTINYGSQGAEFTIAKAGQAPTIQTDFYIFFGRVDVKMQAAPGQGIVSSVVFESDDLDEIDWEFLGGTPDTVQSDFFGKGNTTAYDRAQYQSVTAATTEVHTYSVDWTPDRIEWSIDGSVVRTLASDDALTVGGKNYPQTPMRIKLGNWAAGGPGEPKGTVEWAGGKTNFDDSPFTMYIESVAITNYNPACKYTYGDTSGSWESIQLNNSTDCTSSSSSVSGSNSGSSSGTVSSTSALSGNGTVASATGTSGPTSVATTATDAPTSSHAVSAIMPTGAVVSKTVTGSSYSMNTASAAAQNSGSTMSTATSAATQVPGGSGSSGVNGTETTTGSPSSQSTGAASSNTIFATGSLLSLALGFFFL